MAAAKGLLQGVAAVLKAANAQQQQAQAQPQQQQQVNAIAKYGAAAQRGEAEARYQLARAYDNGTGGVGVRDAKKMFEYALLAANQGHASAQVMLGVAYFKGDGTAEDPQSAVKWMRAAAKQENATACKNLGVWLENGTYGGVKQDLEEARRLYRLAAAKGNEDAKKALERVDPIGTLAAPAIKGDAKAQYSLGMAYRSGKYAKQSDSEAFVWVQKAAQQGLADAECNVGFYYEKGIGTAVDLKLAVEYTRKAAAKGSAVANFNLGVYYENGKGVAKDIEIAKKHFAAAAGKGHANAKRALERIAGSDPVSKYGAAAAKGDRDAAYSLGVCYRTGNGIKRDDKKAFEFMSIAANKGHPAAQCNLGVYYADGVGVAVDNGKAVLWMRNAVRNGNPLAHANIARWLENGLCGLEVNWESAKAYYQVAAEKGVASAKTALDRTTSIEKTLEAAAAGSATAQHDAMQAYRAKKDDKTAFKYGLMAAEQGHAAAQCQVGYWYGVGLAGACAKDEKKSLELTDSSARKGWPTALYNMGCHNENGTFGVKKNLIAALALYKQAAARGHDSAQKVLTRMNIPLPPLLPMSDWTQSAGVTGGNADDGAPVRKPKGLSIGGESPSHANTANAQPPDAPGGPAPATPKSPAAVLSPKGPQKLAALGAAAGPPRPASPNPAAASSPRPPWTCDACSTVNTAKFCGECGAAPKGKPVLSPAASADAAPAPVAAAAPAVPDPADRDAKAAAEAAEAAATRADPPADVKSAPAAGAGDRAAEPAAAVADAGGAVAAVVAKPALQTVPNPDATYVSVSREEDKWDDLDLLFKAGINGQNDVYNAERLKKGLKPITFRLMAVEQIENKALADRFSAKHSELKATRSVEEAKVRWGFHGTRPTNLKKIATNGLLRVGHPLNPSKAVDSGWFGAPTHGVYVSRYVDYCAKYANDLDPLDAGESCKVVMMKVLPGKGFHVQQLKPGMLPTSGYDSHLSANFLEWYLFSEEQVLPCYILTIKAIENRRTDADDKVNKDA